jgi:hypothetical protein
LHELLLEQRHTEGLAERILEQRVKVRDGLLTVAPTNVGVYRTALDGPRPDEGNFDDEVVETTRLQSWQRGHLGARFNLENPHGVGPTQHGVHVVFLR